MRIWVVLAFPRRKCRAVLEGKWFRYLMRRKVHWSNIENGRLILLVFNSSDLLQVVLSTVVPAALQSWDLHITLVAPHALHSDLWELSLALREGDRDCILVKGFHGLWLVDLAFYLGFELLLNGRHSGDYIGNITQDLLIYITLTKSLTIRICWLTSGPMWIWLTVLLVLWCTAHGDCL